MYCLPFFIVAPVLATAAAVGERNINAFVERSDPVTVTIGNVDGLGATGQVTTVIATGTDYLPSLATGNATTVTLSFAPDAACTPVVTTSVANGNSGTTYIGINGTATANGTYSIGTGYAISNAAQTTGTGGGGVTTLVNGDDNESATTVVVQNGSNLSATLAGNVESSIITVAAGQAATVTAQVGSDGVTTAIYATITAGSTSTVTAIASYTVGSDGTTTKYASTGIGAVGCGGYVGTAISASTQSTQSVAASSTVSAGTGVVGALAAEKSSGAASVGVTVRYGTSMIGGLLTVVVGAMMV